MSRSVKAAVVEAENLLQVIKACIPILKDRSGLDHIVSSFIAYNKHILKCKRFNPLESGEDDAVHMDLKGVNDTLTYNQYRVYYILTCIEPAINGQSSPFSYYMRKLRYSEKWTKGDDIRYDNYRKKITFNGVPNDEVIHNLISYSGDFNLQQYECLWF